MLLVPPTQRLHVAPLVTMKSPWSQRGTNTVSEVPAATQRLPMASGVDRHLARHEIALG